ncbi:hypothetical protein ACWGI8_10135 [Streptomyces sp. NPDC054841]
MADVIRCTDAVLARLGIAQRIPFHTQRGGYWEDWDAVGSISDICGPILRALANLERETSRAGFRGVDGDLRNVIFSATQKPDLVRVNSDRESSRSRRTPSTV